MVGGRTFNTPRRWLAVVKGMHGRRSSRWVLLAGLVLAALLISLSHAYLGSGSNRNGSPSNPHSTGHNGNHEWKEAHKPLNGLYVGAKIKPLEDPPPPPPSCEFMEPQEHEPLVRNREFWKSLTKENIQDIQNKWMAFADSELANIPITELGRVFQGRGIVYLTYGNTYTLTRASIRTVRSYLKVTLPIEVYYWEGDLIPDQINELRSMGDVDVIDLSQNSSATNPYWLKSTQSKELTHYNYQLKGAALINSRFAEIIYLDSDNFPLRDPTFLFDSPEFKRYGAMFWPDFWKTPIDSRMWEICNLTCTEEWEFETGQMVLDKVRNWRPMQLAMYMQTNKDLYFRLVWGDKDTFRFAWRALRVEYFFNPYWITLVGNLWTANNRFCGHSIGQHDTEGELLFLHANGWKWNKNQLTLGRNWEWTKRYGAPYHNMHLRVYAWRGDNRFCWDVTDDDGSNGGEVFQRYQRPLIDFESFFAERGGVG
eukprot:jgi/Chlat1/6826/Chrsp51S06516